MSEKSYRDFLRKGDSWGQANIDALPGIDFDAVAEKTNLSLTEDICTTIKHALAEYVSQVRSFESIPLADERKKSLKAVEQACELLESFLEWDAPGVLDDDEYDAMKLFLYDNVTPTVNCFFVDNGKGFPRLSVQSADMFNFSDRGQVVFEGKNVADYLALCRGKIKEEREWLSQSGRRTNSAIRRCLKWLHQSYKKAGGKGRGVTRSADGTFQGPFLTFSKMLLDYTKEPLGEAEYSYSESALGALVVNKYKL